MLSIRAHLQINGYQGSDPNLTDMSIAQNVVSSPDLISLGMANEIFLEALRGGMIRGQRDRPERWRRSP